MTDDVDHTLVDDEVLQTAMHVLGLSDPRGYAAASELRRRLTGEPLPPFTAKPRAVRCPRCGRGGMSTGKLFFSCRYALCREPG